MLWSWVFLELGKDFCKDFLQVMMFTAKSKYVYMLIALALSLLVI